MSLESIIQENTNAIRELIQVIQASSSVKTTEIPEAVKAETLAPVAANQEFTFTDVVKAVTACATKNSKAAAMELLKRYGVEKAKDLRPEQFAAFIEDCEKAA